MADQWTYFYRYSGLEGPDDAEVVRTSGDGIVTTNAPIRTSHDLAMVKASIKDALVGGGPDVFGMHGPQYAHVKVRVDALTLLTRPGDREDAEEGTRRRRIVAAARNVAAAWASTTPAERGLIGDRLDLGVLANDLNDLIKAVNGD